MYLGVISYVAGNNDVEITMIILRKQLDASTEFDGVRTLVNRENIMHL